jgi:two-component system, OmpR family, sensor histidine kinase VicK
VEVPIAVHLAVHVLGLAVAAGLVPVALLQHRDARGRLVLAAGGALLASSHLLLGGLWADPAGLVLLVRAAGFAAVVVGLVVAVVSARGVLGRGRETAPLAIGLAIWGMGDLLTVARPALAAGASLVGSVGVGLWVLRRAGARSLTGRVAGAFVAVLLVLALGLAGASGLVFSADLRTEQVERLAAVAGAQAAELADAAPRELEEAAALLAGGTVLADELLEATSAGEMDARAASITGLPGVDLAVLITTDGLVVGSALRGEPLAGADAASLAGDELAADALAGSAERGLVKIGDGQLVAVGVAPSAPRDEEGQLELERQGGALLVGRPVTAAPLLGAIARETATDAAILTDGRVLASTLSADVDRDLLAASEDGQATVDGQSRLVASAPLAGPNGSTLGSLVLVLPAGSIADAADTAVRSTFVVAVVGLLVAIALAVLISRRMTDPITRLTAAAERIARGEDHSRVPVERSDEVGRLAAAFDDMAIALDGRERQLRAAATTEADLRGRLEAITASMGDALLAVDADGRLLMANPAAASLLGRPIADLLGSPVSDELSVTAEDGGSLLEVLDRAAAAGPATVRGRSSDGERIVLATAAPLVFGDRAEPDGRVYVLRDITEQVRAERLKTEIIANVSHELRTPLTPIRGYLEMLRCRELPSEQVREFATHGADAAERLQRTVDALIDLADLEAGRTEFELVPTDVEDVVGPVLDRWREREPERRIDRCLARDLPPVTVDGPLLGRALDQLLDNALKFSSGPVQLTGERVNGVVRVQVRDRGVGIPPERLANVLDDFEQADGSATREAGGLGLGLSIVQRVLGRFGAGFELDSEPGCGTEVGVLLPIVTEQERT